MTAHNEARKVMQGVVRSNRMDKTVTVEVERIEQHPVYKKYVRRRKRYHAHDEGNTCSVGDRVEIIETRPLSATKRWAVRSIVEKAR
jgi:small subunit ribosomal protein S17